MNFVQPICDPEELSKLVTYYGMIADDTDSVFTDENKTAISLYNSVSISIQAIQELEVKHNKEIAEIKQQHADDNKQLYSEIDALKKLVQKLINDKPEQP